MEQIFFESEHLVLCYYPEQKLVKAIWNGFLSGETLYQSVARCTELLEEKQPDLWMADNRKLKALRMHDQEWLTQNLIPKLAASSLKRMATVISEDIFNQMAIENLHTQASDVVRFEHQFFKSVENGRQWLVAEKESRLSMN